MIDGSRQSHAAGKPLRALACALPGTSAVHSPIAEREPPRMKRWAKYGSIVGYALAMLYMSAWTPAHLGFYIGRTPALLVFAMLIGGSPVEHSRSDQA